MVVLATKEETSTRTVLEIEVPAEEVEKAFAAVITRSYAKRAAIPGFRKGKAPESVISKRFADEIKGDVLEARSSRRGRGGDRGAQARGPRAGPASRTSSGSRPGPIRFAARLDLKPAVDPGDYRGVPVEDVAVEPTDEEVSRVVDRIREAHAEFHPIEGRAAAAGGLRGGRHRRLVRGDPGSRPEPPHVPRREGDAGGRTSGLDARDQRRSARGGARRDPPVPQDVRRRLPERRVPGQDGGLRR